MTARSFKNLFEPIKIGNMTLKNRIVLPPMVTNFGSEDGFVNQRIIDYYVERAKGGAALIVVENGFTAPNGRLTSYGLATYDDKFVPGLTRLVDAIHAHDAKASIQIHHAGPRAHVPDNIEIVGPSLTAVLGRVPKELTISEIQEILAKFAGAAERVRKAGFDAIDLQFGGGYLAGSFLSRVTNKRQDAYGGELNSRARIHREMLKAVRDVVEPGFPIICRVNMLEYGEKVGIAGCLTPEEGKEFARMVEEAGASSISVLLYGFQRARWGVAQDHFPLFPDKPGAYLPFTQEIKKTVKLPVITAGRLTPEAAEEAIRSGQADLVAMGRQLFVDPELPNKASSGRLEDIRPCIGCYRCVSKVLEDKPAECTVNAALGKEREFSIIPAEQKKRVYIVGGGPAGMEAARVCALRGHQVTLFEEQHQLGGLLPLAALIKTPELEDIEALIHYFRMQLKKTGVQIKLGRKVSFELSGKPAPDVIIVAVGAKTSLPEIPGMDSRNVVSPARIRSMAKFYLRFLSPGLLRWLTGFWMPMGRRVVILGGNIIGLELAEFLSRRNKKVTILEEAARMGSDMNLMARIRMIRWLGERRITLLTGVKVERITDKGVSVVNQAGEKQTIEADSVIPASYLGQNTELFKALEGKFAASYIIGDCSKPDLLQHAIADGASVARLI